MNETIKSKLKKIAYKVLVGAMVITLPLSIFWAWTFYTTFVLLDEPYNSLYTDYKVVNSPKALIAKACGATADSDCKEVILLRGGISRGMLEGFSLLLSNTEGDIPDTVCFDSPGGSILISEAMVRLIRHKRLNTCMASRYILNIGGQEIAVTQDIQCSSACPFVLLSGQERFSLGENFKLAVHAPGYDKWYIGTTKHNYYIGDYENSAYQSDYANGLYRQVMDSPEPHQALYHRAMKRPFSVRPLDEVKHEEMREYEIFTNYITDNNHVM